MSGLVLTSAAALDNRRSGPTSRSGRCFLVPPVAARSFPQNDEIALFAEVYDNQASKPHKVDITTTVTSDEGRVVVKTDEVRDSSELQGRRGRLRLRDADPAERAGARIVRADRRGRISPRRHACGRAAGAVHGDRAARGACAMRLLMLCSCSRSCCQRCRRHRCRRRPATCRPNRRQGPDERDRRAAPGCRALGRRVVRAVEDPRPCRTAARGRFLARDGRGRLSRQPADGAATAVEIVRAVGNSARWSWSMSKRRRHATRSRRRY